MSIRIAINGLGRIGRAILKLTIDEPALELVAINDLATWKTIPICFDSTRCTALLEAPGRRTLAVSAKSRKGDGLTMRRASRVNYVSCL